MFLSFFFLGRVKEDRVFNGREILVTNVLEFEGNIMEWKGNHVLELEEKLENPHLCFCP